MHWILSLPPVALSTSVANCCRFSVWKLLAGYAVGRSHLVCAEAGSAQPRVHHDHGDEAFHQDLRFDVRGRCPVPRRRLLEHAILDRPRRHVHRHRRPPPRRHAGDAQAAVRRPRALSRCRGARHPRTARLARRSADSGRRDRGREDGHDGRDQRAARAQPASVRRWSSRAASPMRCASATRTGRSCSCAGSSCPSQLYERVIEADERIGAHGEIVRAPRPRRARARASRRFRRRHSRGRRRADARLSLSRSTSARSPSSRATIGFAQVSVSHEVSPLMKLVSRGDTTVVDAYLSPILRRYVDEVERDARRVARRRRRHRGCSSCSRRAVSPMRGASRARTPSSPAPPGASSAPSRLSRRAGFDRIIGFDMGGTSTDVTHWAGEYERAFVTEVAGVRLRAPMMSIHTVAAGGGSICHVRRRAAARRSAIGGRESGARELSARRDR